MKKLVSILTTLVLALQLTTAYAAGTPTVSISEATDVEIGERVTLNLDMNNVPYWTYVHFELEYDTTALALKSVSSKVEGIGLPDPESGDPMDKPINVLKSQKTSDYPYNIGWLSAEGTCVYNGTMATLAFDVLDGAVAGETYPVVVKFYNKTGKWEEGDQVNYWENVDYPSEDDADWEYHSLDLTYVNGSITLAGGAVETTLKAAKDGDTVSITATAEEFAGKFIVAGYDANGLVDVEVIDAAATATASVDGDTIKVMWWDNLTDLNSIAPAVEL